MGAACCCLRDDFEDFANRSSSMYRNCICLRFYVQNFLNVYSLLFHRGDQHASSSSTQGLTALSTTVSYDNSLSDADRASPRPLPYDTDPRYFWLQRDGLVSRREKGSSHLHEETEPLRTTELDEESEALSSKRKWMEFSSMEESREYDSQSSVTLSAAKTVTGYAHMHSFSEDEDVCPTCLEEYNTENPKIIAKCSHHFHLGCIYEWMERSDNCPVCGKVMAFNETP